LLPLPALELELDPALELQNQFGNLSMLRLLELAQIAEGSSARPPANPAPALSQIPAPTTGDAAPLTPAPATQAAQAEDVAPPQLALANPYENSYALSTDYALSSHLLGLGLNALTPYTNRLSSPLAAGLARFGLASPLVLAEIAAMTYSHEMGHFRAAKPFGGDPKINYPRDAWWAIWSGETSYPSFGFPQNAITNAAGVNQEQWNADYLFLEAARRGGSLSEASAYFLGRTNTFFYSAILPLIKGITKIDDINNYRDDLAAAGHNVSRGPSHGGAG
jgi:hypothetical protein